MHLILCEFVMISFVQDPLAISLHKMRVSLLVVEKFAEKFFVRAHLRVQVDQFADVSGHFPDLFGVKKLQKLNFIVGIDFLVVWVLCKVALSQQSVKFAQLAFGNCARIFL